MARAYSSDLRRRAIDAVLAGATCRAVAVRFDVSVSSVVKWSQRFRTSGEVAARPRGGREPLLPEGERVWLLARLAAVPDATLRGLVAELRERGTVTSYGTVWRVVHRADVSFKKNSVRHRAGPARHSAATRPLEASSRRS